MSSLYVACFSDDQLALAETDILPDSYYKAYNVIRSITGYGKGNGPIILFHEGFLGVAAWNGFLNGADRVSVAEDFLNHCVHI